MENRIIKFRVWDKVDNRMRYENDVDGLKEWPSLLAIGFHGIPIAIDKDSFKDDEIVGWNRDHNLIIMQYSGLSDKNGKEVYESDILLIENEQAWVTFDDGCFCVCGYLGDGRTYPIRDFLFTGRTFEVIGNLYETPSLLEVQHE